MINLIERFLEDEICSQELYECIYEFVNSFHIRVGEFEGNYYIIKKMDRDNLIIFSENIYPDSHREIPNCVSIYKEDLLAAINKHAKMKSLEIKQ